VGVKLSPPVPATPFFSFRPQRAISKLVARPPEPTLVPVGGNCWTIRGSGDREFDDCNELFKSSGWKVDLGAYGECVRVSSRGLNRQQSLLVIIR
jgi:hypothetical protein